MPPPANLCEYPHKSFLARNRDPWATFLSLIVWVYLHLNFSGIGSERHVCNAMQLKPVHNDRSRSIQGSLEVIESNIIRQIACGFLSPSYSNFVSKMHRFRDNGRKSPQKTTPFGTLIWHVPWGDLLRIFRRVIPCQKLESWSYQMVYISWSYFRSAGHNTACDGQTDNRQTDTATLRCRKDRAMQSVARVKIKDTSKPNAFTVKLKRNSPIIWLLQGAVTVSVANKTVQISATPCLKNCKNIFVRTL